MARESTIQILYGSAATTAPVDLSDGEFAFAHGNDKLFIGSNGDNTAVWVGAEILDEDTMSSDSDTKLATQQSIKAYVNAQIGASAGVVSIEGLNGAILLDANTGITLATSGGDTITFSGTDATTSAKGVASFENNDFDVASGAVSLKNSVVRIIKTETGLVNIDAHGLTFTGGEGIDVTHSGTTITVAGEDASTSNKGIASFSSDNFAVASGVVTIKDGGVANAELVNSTFTISDGSNTSPISLGGTLTLQGTSNEVTVAESAGTVTIGLPDDVTIAGNLTVNGTVTTIDTTNLVVEDSMIKLARGNTGANSVDIGFYGVYDPSGTDLYTGLFWDAGDQKYRLFDSLQVEPTDTVNTGGAGYAVGTLVANISGGSF